MSDPLIPGPPWWQPFTAVPGLFLTALLARLLWHHRMVNMGRRSFWSWALVWEAPTAMLSAILGAGLAEWWGLTGTPALAVVGVVSWLGPRGVEDILARIVVHRYPTGGPPE